ncbi:hypothetical protein L218DRAFT_833001, partial [Marasmius fiardii PR-910]
HSWSSDENGKTCFSNSYCESLGLPTQLRVSSVTSRKFSWPTKIYKTIEKWQIARGFNPTTTQFAHYLGYPVYQVI